MLMQWITYLVLACRPPVSSFPSCKLPAEPHNRHFFLSVHISFSSFSLVLVFIICNWYNFNHVRLFIIVDWLLFLLLLVLIFIILTGYHIWFSLVLIFINDYHLHSDKIGLKRCCPERLFLEASQSGLVWIENSRI